MGNLAVGSLGNKVSKIVAKSKLNKLNDDALCFPATIDYKKSEIGFGARHVSGGKKNAVAVPSRCRSWRGCRRGLFWAWMLSPTRSFTGVHSVHGPQPGCTVIVPM